MDKGVKRPNAKKAGRSVAEELTQEYEENAQVVDLHDSEEEEPVKKTPAKRPRAAKNAVKPGTSAGSDTDYSEENDPFISAVKISNRKMNRSAKTYAAVINDLVKAPRTNWNGVDLPTDISPRDTHFWSPRFCFEVRNLRVRRSKLMTGNGATHYVHVLKQNESYGNTDPQRLSFNAALIPHMIQILHDLKTEIDNYGKQ